MLIGITGTDGAGKGVVVEYLVSTKGFSHYHARKLFIAEIEKQGIENNRANMRIVANELRKAHGNDVIVKLFLEQAKNEQDVHIVIDSIRAVAEVETLKANGGILLSIDADRKIRFERILQRNSSSDHVTFEEFVLHEELEMNDTDPNGMQKAKVMSLADYTIENNVSKEDLFKQVDVFLEKFHFE